MDEKNCALLLEYLKNILYDTENATLELTSLDEPFRQLGRGMQFLQSIVGETLTYSAELSRGNLSTEIPARDNFLCTNLKNMHATLNHMTWQAKQVASGDYSQRVSYLGEFSDAFNTMTAQLKEREEALRREAENLKKRSESIGIYNELLAQLMTNRPEWVLVVDAQTRQVVYCNKGNHSGLALGASPCIGCVRQRPERDMILSWSGQEWQVWGIHPEDGTYLHVNSYPVEWQGQNSYVHVVADVTELEHEKQNLSTKAYFDPVTGIYNRAYFEEYTEMLLGEKRCFTLGYLDMDGLKFVNDHYGHSEGDRYIVRFSKLLRANFRSNDVFARIGGDEFCVVMEGKLCQLTERKLEKVRSKLMAIQDTPYPMSFSYGVFEIDPETEPVTLAAVLEKADGRMYQYKRENKKDRTV